MCQPTKEVQNNCEPKACQNRCAPEEKEVKLMRFVEKSSEPLKD